MIINRYLTNEICSNFFGVLLVLLLVSISNKFISFLAKTVTEKLPIQVVFKVVGLYIPELIAYLMPLACFIAILFAYTKLNSESEMTVLFSCGYNWQQIVTIAFKVAVLLMVIISFLTLWINPKLATYREKIINIGQSQAILNILMPGCFQTLQEGKLVGYIEKKVASSNKMQGVFFAEQAVNDNSQQIIIAKYAQVIQDKFSKQPYLIFKDGYRYKGIPGRADFTIIKFNEYGKAFNFPKTDLQHYDRLKATTDIWQSNRPGDQAELQWRLAMPISILVLALIAVGLSKVQPRGGRYAKFLPAILIYIIYYNSMVFAKRALGKDEISGWLGIWWIHILFLMLGFAMLAVASGRWRQWMLSLRNYNK